MVSIACAADRRQRRTGQRALLATVGVRQGASTQELMPTTRHRYAPDVLARPLVRRPGSARPRSRGGGRPPCRPGCVPEACRPVPERPMTNTPMTPDQEFDFYAQPENQEPQGPARRRHASGLGTPVPVRFPPEVPEQARRAADADRRPPPSSNVAHPPWIATRHPPSRESATGTATHIHISRADLIICIHDRGDCHSSGTELRQHPRCRRARRDCGHHPRRGAGRRLVPERRTSADRLKAALRDNPADAGFADDLERVHDDLGSAFSNEVRGWPGG